MKVRKTFLPLAITCLCLTGCQTPTSTNPSSTVAVGERSPQPPQVVKPQPPPPLYQNHAQQEKSRSPEQVQMLSDFAMRESPKIWQTIQSMSGEIAQSGAKIKRLRADLVEFDRDPQPQGLSGYDETRA